MPGFLERLREIRPNERWDALETEAGARLEKFATACPLYARAIEQDPALALWLESTAARTRTLESGDFGRALHREQTALVENEDATELARNHPTYPGLLRRFRRRMSMQIAYRDVAEFAPADEIVAELTHLAELMIREGLAVAHQRTTRRWGEPWDEMRDCAARFVVFGLGKLGGRELNFSSDIDLIYLYEGDGRTRRDGKLTGTTNAEYFQRLAEELTELLNTRDADGFLFRTDLRLRPGGPGAPIVASVSAAEHYYAGLGQTWERLSWLKARAVAGDRETGEELLETLHPFRYPQHPPASLLNDVEAMKARTENEVVGTAALSRDIKTGPGGIREIEFLTQVLQLLHAGRYPFLQTTSTAEALRQLSRYHLLPAADVTFLLDAYWFLRRLENRVQMAEEARTHELPDAPEARETLARSFGLASADELARRLNTMRERVRQHYAALFAAGGERTADGHAEAWWQFFADGRTTPEIEHRVQAWFRHESIDDPGRDLRLFVRGEESMPLAREQVARFVGLAPALDRIMPQLARPTLALRRISAFAERYASRNQFLSACTVNRDFFDVLALLFDRSGFIADLLTRHPEIFEEVLRPENLRRHKDAATRRRELASGPWSSDNVARWLWLYVRAEQVRTAIGDLLGFVPKEELGRELTAIAETTLLEVAAQTPGADQLLLVGLGTLGGGELSFGSDLDLVLVGRTGGPDELNAARALQRRFAGREGRDALYPVDLRLRPHGQDGPLVATLDTFRDYFAHSAQSWERLALTRARVLGGPSELASAWEHWRAELLFARPLSPDQAAELWRMRWRVQKERDPVQPPERAFKTGPGGLMDAEFAWQILQLHHGARDPGLRVPGTRAGWARAAEGGVMSPKLTEDLLQQHGALLDLECCLRRDQNRAVTVIPESPDDQEVIARWLGFGTRTAFWASHVRGMQRGRELVVEALRGVVPSTALETGR